jgi:hypothetical protein
MRTPVAPLALPEPSTLHDGVGRRIEYLRISLTDRCNFRCVYCMPAHGLPWIAREALLDDDEIVEVVRQLAPAGLRGCGSPGASPRCAPGCRRWSRGCAPWTAWRTSPSPPTACGCPRWPARSPRRGSTG